MIQIYNIPVTYLDHIKCNNCILEGEHDLLRDDTNIELTKLLEKVKGLIKKGGDINGT